MNVNTVNIHITNDFKNNHSVNPLKRLSLNCIHIERSLFAKENHIYDIFKILFKEQIGHHLWEKNSLKQEKNMYKKLNNFNDYFPHPIIFLLSFLTCKINRKI